MGDIKVKVKVCSHIGMNFTNINTKKKKEKMNAKLVDRTLRL